MKISLCQIKQIEVMKIIKKTLKWIGLSIGSILLVLIFSGLMLRLFGDKPSPPGKLVDIGEFKLHINSVGAKDDKPTLVIEAGAGGHSEYYYWLGEGLKDRMRVVRYDRAGLGYSELGDTPQDPETVARQLHTLLEKSGESPPYILAGHSYGGHFIRVFNQLYPNEVSALVLLDAPHPDIDERLNIPPSPSWLNSLYYVGAVLGDLGLLDLYTRIYGHVLLAPGVPKEITDRYRDYFLSGKYLWGYIEEERWHKTLVEMSKQIMETDTTPIRVISGTSLNEEALIKMGKDPDFIRSERVKMQEDMAVNSSNGKVVFLEGGHFTIFTKKENADKICEEVIELVADLGYK